MSRQNPEMAAYRLACAEKGAKDLGMIGLQIKRDGSGAKAFVYSHYDFCLQRFLCTLEAFKGMYYGKLDKMNWPFLQDFSPSMFTWME